MALCQTVRREELMEFQRRLLESEHKNAALSKQNDELSASVFELNKWKSEISDIAAEADATFQLQKSQWDEERLALDRRHNIVAEERNKLHHELCTIRAQLDQATEAVHSKTNEVNNLTIQHREFVLQHDGLPDRLTRLQEELNNLRKTFANESRENEQTTTQHAAHNAQLLKQNEELRGELEILEQAKQTEAANASRSLRAAESSFNSELARIEGQRLLQEETVQANLKDARQEAFSQGETAKMLASALDASKAEVESMKKEASKTAQEVKLLCSKLSEAEQAKRGLQEEAVAARGEAEKARLSREEAVARLQRAAEAAADGTEEAMRVVHEYDVAAQQQQEREAGLEKRSSVITAREAELRREKVACVARAAEVDAMRAQQEAAAAETAALQATLQADRQALEQEQKSVEESYTELQQQRESVGEDAKRMMDVLAELESMHAALVKGQGAGGSPGDDSLSADGDPGKREAHAGAQSIAGIMERLREEQGRQKALRAELERLEESRAAAQKQVGKLKREELEAQSKLRGAKAAAAAAVVAAERAEERLRAAEAAAPTPSPVVAEVTEDEAALKSGVGPAEADGVEAASGIIGAISPLLGRFRWGGASRTSATSKAPAAAVKQPPSVGEETSQVEFSVPACTLEAAAPTPQLGHALSQPSDRRSKPTPASKRPRAVLQSAGSGGGSANEAAARAGESADALEAERGDRTRRRVLQDSGLNNGRGGVEEKAPGGGEPGSKPGQADGDDVTPMRESALAGAAQGAACGGTPGTVEKQGPVEGAEADDAGAVEAVGVQAAGGDAAAVVPSPGKKRDGTKKVPRRAGAVAAAGVAQQNGGTSPADAESLMAGMETPLAEPAAAALAGEVAAGDTAHKVTPPAIRTVRLSQVASTAAEGVQVAAGGKTASRPRRTPAPASGLQQRPRRLAASAAAVAVAADAADNATPSVSAGAPSTPGVRPRRQKRTATKRVQMLVEEAAHITGRTPSELVVDDDGPPMSARAARSASRAVSKAGRESSVVEDGEEVEGGGHDAAVDSAEAEHRRRRWRRTQTGTLRTPTQLLPHIDEEDIDDRSERGL